jgi:hypothetical protein
MCITVSSKGSAGKGFKNIRHSYVCLLHGQFGRISQDSEVVPTFCGEIIERTLRVIKSTGPCLSARVSHWDDFAHWMDIPTEAGLIRLQYPPRETGVFVRAFKFIQSFRD